MISRILSTAAGRKSIMFISVGNQHGPVAVAVTIQDLFIMITHGWVGRLAHGWVIDHGWLLHDHGGWSVVTWPAEFVADDTTDQGWSNPFATGPVDVRVAVVPPTVMRI